MRHFESKGSTLPLLLLLDVLRVTGSSAGGGERAGVCASGAAVAQLLCGLQQFYFCRCESWKGSGMTVRCWTAFAGLLLEGLGSSAPNRRAEDMQDKSRRLFPQLSCTKTRCLGFISWTMLKVHPTELYPETKPSRCDGAGTVELCVWAGRSCAGAKD